MSLGIVIKGSEGVVLAADSRVTLFNQLPTDPTDPNKTTVFTSGFDNATKLLRVAGQTHIGAVTYGLGAFMTADGPRTMQSYIPEFEIELKMANVEQLSVDDFAQRLSDFFMQKWNALINRPANAGEQIAFMVGGFDNGAAYGRSFRFVIPDAPFPLEQNAGDFGLNWGGQMDLVNKMLLGFDLDMMDTITAELATMGVTLTAQQGADLKKKLEAKYAAGIPYQFLPLQDCVNLAYFLIQSTINFQQFRSTTIRGVGGEVEIATITRDEGFRFVSQKKIMRRQLELGVH